MPQSSTTSDQRVLDALKLIAAGMSVRAACIETGANRSTVRHHMRRRNIPAPTATGPRPKRVESVTHDGPNVELSTSTEGDADAALRRRGIEPDEYRITNVSVSEFPNGSGALHVKATKKSAFLHAPSGVGWNPPVKPRKKHRSFSAGQVVFLADPHCPYENVPLSRAAERFIGLHSPNLIIALGDVGEHGVLSRHRTHPRFAAMLDETNDACARWLYGMRMANEDAEFILIPGNHDYRILYYAQDYADRLGYGGGRPGRLPDEDEDPLPNLHLRRQYRLDELDIKLIDEDWKLASYPVTSELTARHGYLTGANTAKGYLEKHGRSQVHGHVHRAAVDYRTKHDPLDIRVVMSAGCMARMEPDGLGYDPEPNQTPGVGLGHVWDDGQFVLTFCPFIDNHLLLPWGERISGEE